MERGHVEGDRAVKLHPRRAVPAAQAHRAPSPCRRGRGFSRQEPDASAPARQLYLECERLEARRASRTGRDPLRRRLRRRNAAHRGSLHERDGDLRQRSRDASRLPGGDPRAGRVAARCVGLPGALRGPRHPHPRRPAERPRGHEPRGTEGEHRRSREGRHGHRQHRRLQRPQPPEGGVRRESARRRLARGLPRSPGRALVDDGGGAEGNRGRYLARGRALEELLRARAHVLAVPPSDRRHARLHRDEVREAPRDRRGEHQGVQGWLELRRDVGGLRELVRDRSGEGRAGDVSGRSPATPR